MVGGRADESATAGGHVARRIGIDVAGAALVVARHGLRSAFWNRLAHLGRWVSTQAEPTWLAVPTSIDLLVADDLDQRGRVAAVVAVPGWFGFTDRSALRRVLESESHRIATVVASSTAAAVWASAAGHLGDGARRVLAVDVGTGVTASLLTIDGAAVVELGVGGTAPDDVSEASAASVVAVFDGLLARSARDVADDRADAPPVDAVLLVADDVAAPVVQHIVRHLALIGAGFSPSVVPVVVDRGGVVAEGALALADPAAPPVAAAAPCGLGVLVQDGVAVRVLPVLERGAALPVVVTSLFAGSDAVGSDASQVVVEWVELHDLPLGPPRQALVATGVADLLPTITSAQGVLEVDLLVGGDGELVPLPAACWVVERGAARVRVVSTVDDTGTDDGRTDVGVGHVVSDDDGVGTPGHDSPAPDAPLLGSPLPDGPVLDGESLDDPLLEELARAEVSPLSLGEALVNVERVMSYEVGAPVAIRSIHELLGCADDAEVATLRSAARRLESALAVREGDDALVVAAGEALRAARRAFHDPDRRWCFGGSQAEIEAELARTVEHLELVVGECSPAERRRAAADARAAGLPQARVDDILAALLGPAPVEVIADRAATTEAVVWIDPGDGRCLLRGDVDAVGDAAPVRVMVSSAGLVG